MNEPKAIPHEKVLDPYLQNAVKGTRMPDYTIVDKERDIYGELGWVPNFQVTLSKDNQNLHNTFKEYFDQPKQYSGVFNDTTTSASAFFRKTAPPSSVAKQRSPNQTINQSVLNSTMRSTGRYSMGESTLMGQVNATPFILIPDKSNRHRVNRKLK